MHKLTVILHVDVVGSTALVKFDEMLAHERTRDASRRFSDTIKAFPSVSGIIDTVGGVSDDLELVAH